MGKDEDFSFAIYFYLDPSTDIELMRVIISPIDLAPNCRL
jgi:hypothetical protein